MNKKEKLKKKLVGLTKSLTVSILWNSMKYIKMLD